MPRRTYKPTFIRKWRDHRGLSLRQLANRLEFEPGDKTFSHSSIGRIEKGQQPYSQEVLEAIAIALNVSVVMLLEVDPTKEGEVVDLVRRLDDRKRTEAIAILKALANTA